jgi:hypothetical protein
MDSMARIYRYYNKLCQLEKSFSIALQHSRELINLHSDSINETDHSSKSAQEKVRDEQRKNSA